MTKATSSILHKFKRTISGQGAVRAGKVLTVFTANEDMDDIIKTVESLEDSDLLVDGPTETVKHEIKKQECGFFGAMMVRTTDSLIAPIRSFLINHISGKGVMRTEKGQEDGFFPNF